MSSKRRIFYQLVAPMAVTVGPGEPERRRQFLATHAAPGVAVEVRSASRARDAIESSWDAVVAGPAIVSGIVQAERDGFDAAIVGCFSDPALDAVREAVAIPVVGPGAASVFLALQVADRFSILTPGPGGGGRTRAFLRALGLESRLASVRGVGMSVAEMARAAETGELGAAIGKVAEPARACVEQDGAEALIFGCMSMAFLDPTPAIAERVQVPVINPVLAALRAAETLDSLGLASSRRRWPKATDRPTVELDADGIDSTTDAKQMEVHQ